MDIRKLYPSDFLASELAFKHSRLILPFYGTHSRGREQLLKGVKIGEAYQLDFQGQRFYLNLTESLRQKVTVTNLLVAPIEEAGRGFFHAELTWTFLVSLLENLARSRFVKKLVIAFDTTTSNRDWFIKQGYRATSEGFQKTFDYQLALVLGGGGARGAYQVGVWEALQELEILPKIITGTSVGALNGGLMLVGDVEAAKDLWWDLSTDQVLQFPAAAADNTSFSLLLQQVRSLTMTALKENGASTQPLEELIHEHLDEEKMAENPAELYVCTTHLPDFNEKVVHFDKKNCHTSLQWLIASASFYPAMKAKVIDQEYYMDGGYRNNLPIDVALKNGATELIVVDVNGPGFVKKTSVSPEIAQVTFDSPWTLGSFLVFDPNRSRMNYQLGYLETGKYFGRYEGYWYTFDNESSDPLNDSWQRFCRRLQKSGHPLWQVIKDQAFWSRLSKLYHKKVAFETGGLVFSELCGRLLNVPPEEVYQAETFVAALKTACEKQTQPIEGVLSVAEWLKAYRERLVAFSDLNQMLYWQRSFQQDTTVSKRLLDVTPITAVAGAFLAELTK